MKKFCKAGIIGWLFGTCVTLCLADTAAVVETETIAQGSVNRTLLTWTTSTNGTSAVVADVAKYFRGEIVRVSLLGLTADADYTVTITDSSGQDILSGYGAAIPSNTLTTFKPGLLFYAPGITNVAPMFVNDIFTVAVTNAGDNKTGKIILYWK